MKKLGAILVVVLICCGFIPQHKASRPSSSQKSTTELYAEAIKALVIHKDTLKAREITMGLLKQEILHAPSWSLLARITKDPKMAAECVQHAYRADSTNSYYTTQYADALIVAGMYDKALPILKAALQNSPNPRHYYALAYILDNKQQHEEALAVLDSATVRIGRNPALVKLRQLLLLSQGRILEAEADVKKDIDAAPYVVSNHLALADIYIRTQRDSLAIVSLQNAIAIDTTAVEPWLALADYHDKRGNTAVYLNIMARIFANEEVSTKYKLEEWKSLINDMESYRNFFVYYDTIIKQLYILEPSNNDVVQQYIQHLMRAGDREEAARLSKRMIKGDAPTMENFELVLAIESILQRPDSVSYYTDLALKHDPKNAKWLMWRGAYASDREEYDKAIADYNQALESTEDNDIRINLYARIGFIEHKRNNMKACYKAFDKALKCCNGNDTLRSEIYASLGDIEHRRDNMKGCYKAYDKALKAFADNASVLNNYAYFLSLEGRDLERALTMIDRALTISDRNATNLDTKAWVLYKLGRYAEAKKIMQQALSLNDSKEYTYPLHYGDILHALGEEFMAKTYWRKALELGAEKEEIEKRFLPENTNPKK